jgi:hypothetical protein
MHECLKKGMMTEADLARWLDRPQSTVNKWLQGKNIPWGPGGQDAFKRIEKLESLIASGERFPIPPTLSPKRRKVWVEELKHAHLDVRLFAPDPA